jgi:hypothetical protein
MSITQTSTQLATLKEATVNTVTFHIDVPKELQRGPAQPSRPQTVSLTQPTNT